MESINIVFSSDDNYAQHLGLAILSILENKAPGYSINFHILDGGISSENKEKIKSILKKEEENKIFFINIEKNKFKGFPEKRHLKLPAYYRLLAPYIIDCERILYLDCDLIVLGDLKSLFDINLKKNIIAAATERVGDYIKKYFFREIDSYFNSGVLLIDTKKWQKENIWQNAQEFLSHEKNVYKIKYADQDILNHLLENKWLELNKKYNFQLDIYQKKDNINDIKILHYVGNIKPWHYLYANYYQKYYIKYLEDSPWRNYKFPDYNLKNKIKKNGNKITHKIRLTIQIFLPTKLVLKIKDVILYLNNLRDSK